MEAMTGDEAFDLLQTAALLMAAAHEEEPMRMRERLIEAARTLGAGTSDLVLAEQVGVVRVASQAGLLLVVTAEQMRSVGPGPLRVVGLFDGGDVEGLRTALAEARADALAQVGADAEREADDE